MCALIALHSIAEEGKGSESFVEPLPDFGDKWRFGIRLPEGSNVGKVRVKLGKRTNASLQVFRNGALHVIGLYGPGDKVSLYYS